MVEIDYALGREQTTTAHASLVRYRGQNGIESTGPRQVVEVRAFAALDGIAVWRTRPDDGEA